MARTAAITLMSRAWMAVANANPEQLVKPGKYALISTFVYRVVHLIKPHVGQFAATIIRNTAPGQSAAAVASQTISRAEMSAATPIRTCVWEDTVSAKPGSRMMIRRNQRAEEVGGLRLGWIFS